MKPDKVNMFYHEQTNTTWVNDPNWEERWKTEVIGYGTVEIDTDNIFEVKTAMKDYYLVKRNPF